jgi:8-oxo-dGTP diphosphatase
MTRAEDSKAPPDYDPSDYPPVAVAVDVVALAVHGAVLSDGRLRGGQLSVLLIQRGGAPFKGYWALPGGFLRPNETLRQAAVRETREETGLPNIEGHLEQLGTYGDPDRDARMRVVSVAYLAVMPMPNVQLPAAGSDAVDAQWRPVKELLNSRGTSLAFDHQTILADAVERTRAKLEYTNLATYFLGAEFTLGDLRRVYESVWDLEQGLEPANFRRTMLGTADLLKATGRTNASGSGRPADLYERGPAVLLDRHMLRPKPTGKTARKSGRTGG